MKIFLLICLASGLASSEKLDRSYLPPPGSKFSGGRPGDIEVPFEFPKETYSTGRPPIVDGKPDIELGINRRPVAPTGAPENRKPGFSNFQNYVPTTTTSYAITQTTTFAPGKDYGGVNQPITFINGSNRIQPNIPNQTYQQQPTRGPGQGPTFQYRPGQNQPSAGTYGTTPRPGFPGTFKGPDYLPPAPPSINRGKPNGPVSSNGQDDIGYPSRQPQGPKYQDGQLPEYVSPGFQQHQFTGNQNTPSSTTAPQYQDASFDPTGPRYQQNGNQFQGSQFPSSTSAPQFQNGQRIHSSEPNQQNKFLGNQNLPSSTAAPSYQTDLQFSTPGLTQQQFESRVPNEQTQYTGNRNIPSSTSPPSTIQNFLSTTAPNYQNRQSFATPDQIQGGVVPSDQRFGSRAPIQNKYRGNQNFPSTTAAPQSQGGERLSTPGYVEEGYQYHVPTLQNQNHAGNQIFPSSTSTPQYQNGQQFTSSGPIRQNQYPNENLPSTGAPIYQDGQRFTTPGQHQSGLLSDQQRFGSRIPSQNQFTGNQNLPSSTIAPQYHEGQRYTTPGGEYYTQSSNKPTPDSNQFVGNQNFPSTAAPNYQNGQRFTTPSQIQEGSVPEKQRFGSRVPSQQNQNQYAGNVPPSTVGPQYQAGQRFTTPENQYPGSQDIPSSTAVPQYHGQRVTTPGQQGSFPNQPNYPGSTVIPQYQPTFESTPGTNQQGFIPNQQNQYQRPAYNQIPSSTTAPGRFIPGSQTYGIQSTPATAVSFPETQTGDQTAPTYGISQQPTSQPGSGFPAYGTTPSAPFLNQGFPSTTTGSLPVRDFSSTSGSAVAGRPERPQAEGDRNAEIISYENVLTPEGYYYSYDTSNGIHADETGTVGNGTRAQGGFSYTGDDGNVYSVFYSADENGFLPRGDHLPTPPPIPEAIQRVIDQVNKDKEAGIEDDGSYNEEKYGYTKYEGHLSRLRPQNKTVLTVNGADIPNKTKNRIGKPNKKVMKLQGSRVTTKKYLEGDSDEKLDTEPESDDVDKTEQEIRGYNDNSNENTDTNKRVGSKRPKPITNLTVEDSRPNKLKGNKMAIKSTINSTDDLLENSKKIDEDGFSRRPVSPEENESSDFVFDSDSSEEQEDSENLRESDEIDYSDLINYKDDPNNRTDFHGLNKYLPKPKGQKTQSSKKRPTADVDGTRRTVTGATKTEQSKELNSKTPHEFESDDKARSRIPSRKNQFGLKMKDLSKTSEQPVTFDSDDETNTYSNDDAIYNTRPVSNNRMDKPKTSQSNKKISKNAKRPTVNKNTGQPINKDTHKKLSFDEEYGYKTSAYSDDEAQSNEEYGSDGKLRPVAADRMDKPRISQSSKNISEKPKRPNGIRIPSNKNTKLSSEEETGSEYTAFSDDEVGKHIEYNSDDETIPVATYRTDKTRISQSNKKITGKPKSPTVNEGIGIPAEVGTGYDYTPPQRKFESEGATKFPARTSQTTRRPFMTKNVYGDDNESADEDVDQFGIVKSGRPVRPMPTQNQQHIGFKQRGDRYDENPNVDVIENERFTSTRKPIYGPTSSRRPFGRPQTTALPQYEGQSMTDEDIYNVPVGNQGLQTPGDKLYYNTNAPNRGTSKTDSVFGSTTPLPVSESYMKYHPGQYQDKLADGSVYNYEDKDGEISINRPGKQPISGQYPSTTYRPNYSFGDRTLAPNSPVTVDGFGRPITSTKGPVNVDRLGQPITSTNGPVNVDRFGRPITTTTIGSVFDGTVKPSYSTQRLSSDAQLGNGPSQTGDYMTPKGRFGVTSTQRPGHQSSASAPIGEDFSGPKQPQRYDPDSGYYYK